MRGKYIIFDRNGLEYPVLFPDSFVSHNEITILNDKPVAAGFFSISVNDINELECFAYGESVSLKLKSRHDDFRIIGKQFGIYNE